MSEYKPRNATEGFMLGEIEYLKKTLAEHKEKINVLEEDNDRLNKLVDWYKHNAKVIKDNYDEAHSLWQATCLESDCIGMQLEEENKKLKESIETLESDLGNLRCEFGFECEECNYWKRVNKRLRNLLLQNNIHYDVKGETVTQICGVV